jgi:hypothetical protein
VYNAAMSVIPVAEFNTTKSNERVDVVRGTNPYIEDQLYQHSFDPGIVRTLGTKDSTNRFHPEKIEGWLAKKGGRFLYTGWVRNELAGVWWAGIEDFPTDHFPEYEGDKPEWTKAWRTEYSRPGQENVPADEQKTWGGEGIGKRLAIAGVADVLALTANGGPDGRPSLGESGDWIDTGIYNEAGKGLYHHLGYQDIGVFTPKEKPGMSNIEREPRVGMIMTPEAQWVLAAKAGQYVTMLA